MQSWLFLVIAIVFEIAGTTMMKLSESLTRWWYIPPMILFYLLALGGLALALRTIEVGIAYAVWAGVGTLMIAIIGIAFFGESATLLKLVSIGMIIAGVIGLHLADTLGSAGVR